MLPSPSHAPGGGDERTGGGERRSARFVQRNLNLLGFGSHERALVQTVKELFENALDATHLSAPCDSWEHAQPEMLRIDVHGDALGGVIDVVCADTGSGIRTHQLKQLCCGIGLKAAMLYSQQHAPHASLKIVTTADSSAVLCVQLRLDPQSEEPAVVQTLTQFVVDDGGNDDGDAAHTRFSGTQMRLTLPCPRTSHDLERAADTLAVYFQSARFTLPPFLGVAFRFEVAGVSVRVDCAVGEQPIDRFTADLGACDDDIAYAERSEPQFSVNCMAVILGSSSDNSCSPNGPSSRSSEPPGELQICVLRYANHVPLITADDVAQCGVVKGVLSARTWKQLGLRCQVARSSCFVNQLVATPLRANNASRSGCNAASASSSSSSSSAPRQLVLAIDVCARHGSVIEYNGLAKSTLAPRYSDAVRMCCQIALRQLVMRGALQTPQQWRDNELVTTFAPLIASAVVSIARHAVPSVREQDCAPRRVLKLLERERVDVDEVTARVQELVMADIGYLRSLK